MVCACLHARRSIRLMMYIGIRKCQLRQHCLKPIDTVTPAGSGGGSQPGVPARAAAPAGAPVSALPHTGSPRGVAPMRSTGHRELPGGGDADTRSKAKTATKEGDKVLWNPTQAKFELMELSQRKEKLHARLQVCVVFAGASAQGFVFLYACMQTCMHTYKRQSNTH